MRKVAVVLKMLIACAAAAAVGAFALLLLHAPAFQKSNSYELYLSPSSSALILSTDRPARDKLLLHAAGESVRYDGDCAEELLARYRAEVLFCEEAGGVTNYYCYSPLLNAEIALGEYLVNLHVAVGEGQTAAGTPLIFGGF